MVWYDTGESMPRIKCKICGKQLYGMSMKQLKTIMFYHLLTHEEARKSLKIDRIVEEILEKYTKMESEEP